MTTSISGESSYKLNSGKSMNMNDVLFILGLNNKLLSIYALDAKGMRIAFVDGQVLMWPKGKTVDDAVVIERGRLIQTKAPTKTSLGPCFSRAK